jgi:hypothetical protein
MLMNTHLQAHRPNQSSIHARLAIVAGAALACTLFAGPIYAATEAKPAPQTTKRERLTIAAEEAMKPWTGDLDGMIKRRFIRVLTVYSKTFYTEIIGDVAHNHHNSFYSFQGFLLMAIAIAEAPTPNLLAISAIEIPISRFKKHAISALTFAVFRL